MKDNFFNFVPLGDVVDVVGGGTPSKRNPAFYGGEIPWATVRDMKLENLQETEHSITPEGLKGSSSKVIPAGEIVIATRVGLGKVCILSQDTAINQDLRGLIPKPTASIDRRFLFYWFTSIADKVIEAGTGATVQGVKLPFVKSLPFPRVPLEEQQRIVAVLDEAFEGLTRARAHAEANLQNARELFAGVLDSVFSDSPEHWTWSYLGETCTFIGGSQPPKSEFVYTPAGDLVRLIQIRDYKSDKNIVYIPLTTARRFCEEDDVMIGRYGPPLFQILRGIKGAYNVALMKAIPDPELMSKDFLYYFLQNRKIFQYINNASSRAAGQIGLNKATLAPYPISYPNKHEQREVVRRLDAAKSQCDKAIEQFEAKLQDLDDLRQSLLQKAFAGELT